MSKSRNRKWYDSDDDYQEFKERKKGVDRRSKKQMKNDLRSKNFEVYDDDDDSNHRYSK